MELSDKVRKIKQVSKSHAFSKQEAEDICRAFDIPIDEMRDCYSASQEKEAFCNYWRTRYSEKVGSARGINARIRASIAADKRKAA